MTCNLWAISGVSYRVDYIMIPTRRVGHYIVLHIQDVADILHGRFTTAKLWNYVVIPTRRDNLLYRLSKGWVISPKNGR